MHDFADQGTIINLNIEIMETLNKNINLSYVAEITISYNQKIKASQRPVVKSSMDVFKILSNNWNRDKIDLLEQFKIILVNRSHKILGIVGISTGGIAGCIVDSKIIFATTLKSCASGIILAHNHPSGNLTPSSADINLTNKIIAGAEILDLLVLDHIIISSEGYYSFKDEGLI